MVFWSPKWAPKTIKKRWFLSSKSEILDISGYTRIGAPNGGFWTPQYGGLGPNGGPDHLPRAVGPSGRAVGPSGRAVGPSGRVTGPSGRVIGSSGRAINHRDMSSYDDII